MMVQTLASRVRSLIIVATLDFMMLAVAGSTHANVPMMTHMYEVRGSDGSEYIGLSAGGWWDPSGYLWSDFGEQTIKVESCGSEHLNRKFVCLFSSVVAFSFPREWYSTQTKWTVGNRAFEIVGHEKIVEFEGWSANEALWVRETGSPKAKFEYLYSPYVGLIGIRELVPLRKDGKLRTYWIATQIGAVKSWVGN